MKKPLIDHFLADSGVGALAADRAWPGVRPQGTDVPALTVNRAGGAEGLHLQGPDGLDAALMQVDCWGSTAAEAEALATAVKASFPGGRADGLLGALVENERDGFEHTDTGKIHRVSIDLRVWRRA